MLSVLTASYNYAAFLPAALDSVLNQTMPDWELIAVDDGSTDASWDILQDYAARDDRIRVLAHPGRVNRGLAATLRLGLAHARGAFTAFLESDDLWTPDCLERRVARLTAHPADIVYNDCALLGDPHSRRVRVQAHIVAACRAFALAQPDVFRLGDAILCTNLIPTFSCAMCRTALLKNADFSPPVPAWLDYWLWVQLGAFARCAFLDRPLTQWRIHPHSYNARPGRAKAARFLRFSRALAKAAPAFGYTLSGPAFWVRRVWRKARLQAGAQWAARRLPAS